MTTRAEYEIRLKDAFTPGLKKATNEMNNFESKLGGIQNMAGKLGIALSFAAVGAGIKKLSDLGAAAEQTRISFEVLAGSAAKGNTLLAQLKEYANITPYVSSDVLQASKVMLGFGIAQEKVLPTMKMLGDVASGDAERLKSLALVYGQINAAGRLMGQDLLQLINNGFNPLQVMAQRSGKKIGELKKMMEDGAISAKDVAKAFQIATSEGGLFFDMTNRQSQTFAGKLSTLTDLLEVKGTQIGDTLNKKLTPILDKILLVLNKSEKPVDTEIELLKKSRGNLGSFNALYESYLQAKGTAFESQFKEQLYNNYPIVGKDISGAQDYKKMLEQVINSFSVGESAYQSNKSIKNQMYLLSQEISTREPFTGRSGYEKLTGKGFLSNDELKERLTKFDELNEKIKQNTQKSSEFYKGYGKASPEMRNQAIDALLGSFGLSRKTGPKFDFESGTQVKKKKGRGGEGQENERLGGTKNITINVAKLIGIETNQQTKNIDPTTIGEAVKRELLTALHDANLAITN